MEAQNAENVSQYYDLAVLKAELTMDCHHLVFL